MPKPACDVLLNAVRAGTCWSILLVTACASGPDVLTSQYRAPGSEPRLVDSIELFGSASATLANSASDLSAKGYRTNDPSSSEVLTAIYSGTLDGYVDCGELTLPGETRTRPAATSQMTIAAFDDQPNWRALRQMRLDARAVTRTRASQTGFRARTDVTYVITRTVDTISASGSVLGTDREIISLESGGIGRFENGLTCQPTGRMESEIGEIVTAAASLGGGIEGLTPLDEALPIDEARDLAITTTPVEGAPATIIGAPGETGDAESSVAHVSPPESDCGSLSKDEVAIAAAGACGLQRFADRIGTAAYPGFEVTVAGGEEGLAEGSPLTLEVSLPGGNRYFHTVQLASDGTIYHAGPKYIDKDSIGERFLYQTGLDLAANDKLELIVALSSSTEIFSFERPANEPVLDFLALMNERFSDGESDLAVISIRRRIP